MKSKELKVYNLPQENQVANILDAKPYGLLAGLILLGIIMILFKISTMYGIAIAIIGCGFIIFLPKTVLIEFFNDHMVLHNKASKDECVLIYYEEIVSFEYKRGINSDFLYIELEDGSIEKIEAFSKLLFESFMNHYCPGKQKVK